MKSINEREINFERKEGTIKTWNGRWGIVFVTNKQRFFLHISEFDSASDPKIGDIISFDVKEPFPGTSGENKLPRAVNAILIDYLQDETSSDATETGRAL